MLNTVIFDLDGTLLPIDHDAFINEYFKKMIKAIAPKGFDPPALIESVKKGTDAMVQNDGSMRNDQRFWKVFETYHGKGSVKAEEFFLAFYQEEFPLFEKLANPDPLVKLIAQELVDKNYDLILATNPLFPMVATESRIKWAGLDPGIFSYISTYENASFSKPKIEYYKEILEKTNKKAENCLMVGNGIDDDMIIAELGALTFLVTDSNDPAVLHHQYVTQAGTRQVLYEYVKQLPAMQ